MPAAGTAQSPATGALRGTIVDAAGGELAAVHGHFGWQFADGSAVRLTALVPDAERHVAPMSVRSGPVTATVEGTDGFAAAGFTVQATDQVGRSAGFQPPTLPGDS